MARRVTKEPIAIDGHIIGESIMVEYDSTETTLGLCQHKNCGALATSETLLGLQLCTSHFDDFYCITPERNS